MAQHITKQCSISRTSYHCYRSRESLHKSDELSYAAKKTFSSATVHQKPLEDIQSTENIAVNIKTGKLVRYAETEDFSDFVQMSLEKLRTDKELVLGKLNIKPGITLYRLQNDKLEPLDIRKTAPTNFAASSSNMPETQHAKVIVSPLSFARPLPHLQLDEESEAPKEKGSQIDNTHL